MNLDDEYFDDNDKDDYEEKEESLKSISLYQVQENYKLILKKKIFNRFEKKWFYKKKLKWYKENWMKFIDYMIEDLI